MATHRYRLEATWTGDRGTGTSGYRDYDRDVTLRVAGKPDLLGSADRPFRGDPSRWNPEDLLLAALAQCHLLSYLHLAVVHGLVVTGYRDAATGTMEQHGIGGRFTEVVLRPEVTLAAGADADRRARATALHHEASQACFVAASVAFPVRHEPTTRVAGDGGA